MRSSFTRRGTGRLFGAVLSFLLLFQLVIFQVQVPIAQAAVFNIPNGDVAALKAALTAPNPPHVINLAAGGLYELTSVDNTDSFGSNGLPVISSTITINGNGATIRRIAQPPEFRLLFVAEGASLVINDLVLENGFNIDVFGGGAIYNNGGNLVVNNSRFHLNRSAVGGGAIANVSQAKTQPGTFVTATLVVNNSTFTGNNMLQGFGGGAIYNASGGTNSSNGTYGTASSILTVTNSTFEGNQSSVGGTTSGSGGAIANMAGGTAANRGGSFTAKATVVNSTLFGNQAQQGSAIVNLGLGEVGSNTNSIFDGINLTIANNGAATNPGGGALIAGTFFGGGTVTTNIKNTLFANNQGGNCKTSGAVSLTGTTNQEYAANQFDLSCQTISTALNSNPLLSVGLFDNGGSTRTVGLKPGSAPIDAGDNAVCADIDTVNNRDQRGVTRPQQTACDVGAFEFNGAPSFVVTTTQDNAQTPVSGSLRAKIALAPDFPDTIITFDPALGTNPVINLANPLNIKGNFTIQGDCTNKVRLNFTTDSPFFDPYAVKIEGGVRLQGVEITSNNLTIMALTGSNKLECSVVRKS